MNVPPDNNRVTSPRIHPKSYVTRNDVIKYSILASSATCIGIYTYLYRNYESVRRPMKKYHRKLQTRLLKSTNSFVKSSLPLFISDCLILYAVYSYQQRRAQRKEVAKGKANELMDKTLDEHCYGTFKYGSLGSIKTGELHAPLPPRLWGSTSTVHCRNRCSNLLLNTVSS